MIKKEDLLNSHKCPVCGKYEFDMHDSFDVCPVCKWCDDLVQEYDPDFGGCNSYTLNQYRALYRAKKLGLDDKGRCAWLDEHGYFKD